MASETAQPRKRTKVDAACEACRKRKSRCDGARPACSYCRTTERECIYTMPTETSHGIDQAVLDRLDYLEAQLQTARSNGFGGDLQLPIPNIPTGRLSQSSAGSRTGSDGDVIDKNPSHAQIPVFHTAATHKMLHYWPRIKMNTTSESFEPLRYVENTEGGGFPPPASFHTAEADRLHVEAWFENALADATGLEFLLCQLLLDHTQAFTMPLQTQTPAPIEGSNANSVTLHHLSCQTLLVTTLVAKIASQRSWAMNPGQSRAEEIEAATFAIALSKLGVLFLSEDDDSVPYMILAAYLLMFYSYPYAALKYIQAAGDRLGRCGQRPVDNLWWRRRFQDCLMVHHIVESDILLTVDGLPSLAAFAHVRILCEEKMAEERDNMFPATPTTEPPAAIQNRILLSKAFEITSIQNRTLSRLYSIEMAYSPPSTMGSHIAALKADLCRWFDSLPLEWHFPRDLTGAITIRSPKFLEGLRRSYYVVEFLMCRPIVYYIAHQTYEQQEVSLRANEGAILGLANLPFWVSDACHRCLQCAALLILGSEVREFQTCPSNSAIIHTELKGWFELHLLWGAALTLALAASTPELTTLIPVYGTIIDANYLLDKVEAILDLHSTRSSIVPTCATVLRNIRQNLSVSSTTAAESMLLMGISAFGPAQELFAQLHQEVASV
ncbi:hypothetical protein F4825DRAFT_468247 [Nemania diffusa]|nr:hypothetical protein F4825DRAFT_468247 [Nemania diffusa]